MNIAIIGGGMTGLTAGYMLSQSGHKVTVYEKENPLGGLASAVNIGSEAIDRFYHHIFVNDSEILSLINELNLNNRLDWYKPQNAVYADNTLHPFSTPLDLLLFKPLSLFHRIRLGIMVLSSAFIRDYSSFESITAKEWIIRHSGREVWRKVWEPLIKSKFDIDSNNISGAWIWNKLKLRGTSRGNCLRKEILGYMDGAFITIADELAKQIIHNNGDILTGQKVTSIARNENGKVDVAVQDCKTSYDKVLFTGAPGLLSEILKSAPDTSDIKQYRDQEIIADDETLVPKAGEISSSEKAGSTLGVRDGRHIHTSYKESLDRISYKANICLILELSRSLSPYYWITVAQEGLPFVLIVEHTNLVGVKGYGSHVVYLSRYLDVSDPLYRAQDKDLIIEFINGLKKVFPDIKNENIKKTTLSRAAFAQPVITVGYEKNIPDIKTPIEGLYLASMPQIYPEDRGLNYAVRLGQEAANEILEDL
ncbi:MAG: NAD(P)/FAD-dependent oxidoreductase [Acetivibrionales bacterium]|jgi:protoporphyrinogen oxidase